MKKLALYCLVAIVGIASLTSCGGSETAAPADPTIKAENGATYTTNKFEKGETVKVKVTATIPGGVEIFQIWKKVGSGTNTDVSSTYSANFPAAGATSYDKTFDITVAETYSNTAAENVVVFTFKVRSSSMAAGKFIETTYTYNVAAQGQGGGGGVAPLLFSRLSVGLGSQGNNSLGSYYSSYRGILSTSTEAGALSDANKALVDLTFGVVGSDGNYATGASATTPQIISPDARAGKGFNNPLSTFASTSYFVAYTAKPFAEVTASIVNNLTVANTEPKFKTIAANDVIAFKNGNRKGVIKIVSITGTNDDRTATIDVLVQQVQ